jgi:hypothetical protein
MVGLLTDEPEWMGKEMVDVIETLPQKLTGEAEENNRNLNQDSRHIG